MTRAMKHVSIAAAAGLLALCAFAASPAAADPVSLVRGLRQHRRRRDELLFRDDRAVPGDGVRQWRLLHAEQLLHGGRSTATGRRRARAAIAPRADADRTTVRAERSAMRLVRYAKESAMRLAVAVLVTLVAGLVLDDSAKADPYRWCAQYSGRARRHQLLFHDHRSVSGRRVGRRRLLPPQPVLHRRRPAAAEVSQGVLSFVGSADACQAKQAGSGPAKMHIVAASLC